MNENLKENLENMGIDNDFLQKRLEKIENLFLNSIKSDIEENTKIVKDDIVNSIK